MVGCVWNGFFLAGSGGSLFHVGSAVLLTVMVIFFGVCTFPPLVEVRENPEFHDLKRMDKAHWPRRLLWHGWLPMLSGVNGDSPWAADATQSAGYLVEVALVGIRLVYWLIGAPLMVLMLLRLVALFWIRSQVYPPLVLDSMPGKLLE